MTLRGLGRIVPSQVTLLELAGLVVSGRGVVHDPTDAQIAESRDRAYACLRKMTGQDFGYDVVAWFRWLVVQEDDRGITHPYGYHTMRGKLKERGITLPFKKDVLADLG